MRQRTPARYAIRVDEHTLLAVPPMHPDLPPAVRQRVFEYVLRRQPALAALVAGDAHVDGMAGARARLAALMGETPHRNARGSQMGMAA